MAKKLVVLMLAAMTAVAGRQTVMAEEVTFVENEANELTEEDYNGFLCDEQIPLLIDKFEDDNWHFMIRAAEVETPPQQMSVLGALNSDDLHEKLLTMADSHNWEFHLIFGDQQMDVALNKTNSLIHQGDVIVDTVLVNHVLYTEKIHYRVAKDDTLQEIAQKYHVTVQEIVDLNDVIVDPNLIYYDTYLDLPLTATTKEME